MTLDVKQMTDCLHSGLVIDQTRKDGFRFRNVEEVPHPPSLDTLPVNPTVGDVLGIEEKAGDDDPEKEKV